MYLVLDREFISKTEIRGSVYRLPVISYTRSCIYGMHMRSTTGVERLSPKKYSQGFYFFDDALSSAGLLFLLHSKPFVLRNIGGTPIVRPDPLLYPR